MVLCYQLKFYRQTWKSILSLTCSMEHSVQKLMTLKNCLGDTKKKKVVCMWEEEKTLLNLSKSPLPTQGRGDKYWELPSPWPQPLREVPVISLPCWGWPWGVPMCAQPWNTCTFILVLTHLPFGAFSTLITAALAHLCSNSHLRITPPSPNQNLGCFHWICQLKKNVSVKSADYRLIY